MNREIRNYFVLGIFFLIFTIVFGGSSFFFYQFNQKLDKMPNIEKYSSELNSIEILTNVKILEENKPIYEDLVTYDIENYYKKSAGSSSSGWRVEEKKHPDLIVEFGGKRITLTGDYNIRSYNKIYPSKTEPNSVRYSGFTVGNVVGVKGIIFGNKNGEPIKLVPSLIDGEGIQSYLDNQKLGLKICIISFLFSITLSSILFSIGIHKRKKIQL